MNFLLKTFKELSIDELYSIMALRQEVFIVEQECFYLDADGKDQLCHHLLGYKGDKLIAYTRILNKGISYDEYSSIGRVVNSPSVRGTGMGKILMQKSIEACMHLFPDLPIKISAQEYLRSFYESFDFKSNGEFYLEDDIPHMGMIYYPKA